MNRLENVRNNINYLVSLPDQASATEKDTAAAKLKEVSGWIKDHPSEAQALVADSKLFSQCVTVIDKFEKRRDQTEEEKKDVQAFSDSIIKTSIVSSASLGQSYAQLLEMLKSRPDLSLDTLYQNREGADFTLVFPGAKSIPVHKAVLEARSPYFAGLFASGMKEMETNSITFPDEDPQLFEAFIRYLYTGQIDITADNVMGLLVIADKFNALSLLSKCQTFFAEITDFDELKALFEFGEAVNSTPIKQAVCNQVFETLRNQPSFDLNDKRFPFLEQHGSYVTKLDLRDRPVSEKEAKTEYHAVEAYQKKLVTLFSKFTAVEELRIDTEFLLSLPQALSGFKELRTLDIMKGDYFPGAQDLKEIVTNNPHLRTLCLNRTHISREEMPAIMGQLNELRNLSLYYSDVRDPNVISNIEKLQLVFDFTVNLNSFSTIIKTGKFETLSLKGATITPELCDILLQSKSLKKIYLPAQEWDLTPEVLNKVAELKKRFDVELVPADQPIDFMEIAS